MSDELRKLIELVGVLRDGGMHGAAGRVQWAADEIVRLQTLLEMAERERSRTRDQVIGLAVRLNEMDR